eukprot:symbB.v1.2.022691.t1/scaffold2012.1/size92363/2
MQKIFALNCFGPLWLSRAAMPHLKKAEEASIIMIGSAAGGRPMGSSIPYSMTRAAMNHLTKLLAKSQGPVRVNCVAPGLIETRITDGNEWDGSHAAVKTHTPLKRVGQPVDLTEAVLCCIRSRYMTGQIIYRLMSKSLKLPSRNFHQILIRLQHHGGGNPHKVGQAYFWDPILKKKGFFLETRPVSGTAGIWRPFRWLPDFGVLVPAASCGHLSWIASMLEWPNVASMEFRGLCPLISLSQCALNHK